ncbi:MAG TPA: T9SS type A sorting domain-containing protein [Bacteroidales bacterium]|nr:T9SS type A sorting domain-containing protein [Bacteroidales bacterium]
MKTQNFLLALILCIQCANAQTNLLCDSFFDSPQNQGGQQIPASGCWIPNYLGQAGMVIDGAHCMSFPYSLHIYTGAAVADSFSYPLQTDISVSPGDSAEAGAYLWTPAGFTWQNNSQASVLLYFKNNSGAYLATYYQSDLYSNFNASPTLFRVRCKVPYNAVKAEFRILLRKINTYGISVINADNAYLNAFPDLNVDISEMSLFGFDLYPNPASGFINICKGASANAKVEIYNCNSELNCTRGANNNNNEKIDISFLKPGLYFFKVLTNNQSVVRKVVIY